MFSNKDILNDEHMIKFINSRNLRPNSVRVYKIAIKNYCNYTGLTPSQLINEADEEQDKGIKKKNRKIKNYLQGFINHLNNKGRAANTINSSFTNIKSFYHEFDIDLPKVKCKIKDTEELLTIKDIPEKEHIKKALKYANLCYTAIIKLMMSSGMGSGEIRNLSLKDYIDAHGIRKYSISDFEKVIKKLQEKENEIPTWSIRRIKTGMPYITFSSLEANRAINEYLEDRNEKKPIMDINDFLFVSKIHKKISNRSFAQYFQRLNDNAGFGFYKNQRFFRGHALRKFFASTLHNNGMDYLDAEWLIGHRVKITTGTYIKPDINRLKNDYVKILPFLSLSEVGTVTLESPEFKELKDKYENESKAKDKEIKKLKTEKDHEIRLLKEENERIREENLKTKKLVEDFINNAGTDEEIKLLREENAKTKKLVEDLMKNIKMKE